MQLAVDISTNSDRRPHIRSVGLFKQNVPGLLSNKLNLLLSDGFKILNIFDNIFQLAGVVLHIKFELL